jgi:hypothetical protein
MVQYGWGTVGEEKKWTAEQVRWILSVHIMSTGQGGGVTVDTETVYYIILHHHIQMWTVQLDRDDLKP